MSLISPVTVINHAAEIREQGRGRGSWWFMWSTIGGKESKSFEKDWEGVLFLFYFCYLIDAISVKILRYSANLFCLMNCTKIFSLPVTAGSLYHSRVTFYVCFKKRRASLSVKPQPNICRFKEKKKKDSSFIGRVFKLQFNPYTCCFFLILLSYVLCSSWPPEVLWDNWIRARGCRLWCSRGASCDSKVPCGSWSPSGPVHRNKRWLVFWADFFRPFSQTVVF